MVRQKSPIRTVALDPEVCSLDYRLKIIGRLPFFKQLPPDAIVYINSLFHDKDFSPTQRIYSEGGEAGHLFLVATGKVKLMVNTSAGHEVLLDILQGGEYFGNLVSIGEGTYTESAIALTDCCILQISSSDFDLILSRYPNVTLKVLGAVGKRLAESQEVVKQLSTYTAEQKIASALIRLGNKMGEVRPDGLLIQIPLSRQDLASMAGTTAETASRVMSRFSETGWIKSGRRWVTILDEAKLREQIKTGAVK